MSDTWVAEVAVETWESSASGVTFTVALNPTINLTGGGVGSGGSEGPWRGLRDGLGDNQTFDLTKGVQQFIEGEGGGTVVMPSPTVGTPDYRVWMVIAPLDGPVVLDGTAASIGIRALDGTVAQTYTIPAGVNVLIEQRDGVSPNYSYSVVLTSASGGGAVTSVDGDTGAVDLSGSYDPLGAADAAETAADAYADAVIVIHAAESDPHGDRAYAAGAVATHAAAADPHTGYMLETNIGTGPSQVPTTTDVDVRIGAIVGAAPGALDTLVELASALQADESTAAALATTVGLKLAKASNLSDLASASTSRTNLGLGSLSTQSAVTSAQLPTGMWLPISNTTLSVDTALHQVTVTGYKLIRLMFVGKTTRSTASTLKVQMNSDTTTNYHNAGSTSTAMLPGVLAGTNTVGNTVADLTITNMAAGVPKSVQGSIYSPNAAVYASFGGCWDDVTSLATTIDLSSANSANLASGSRIAVWGIA